MQGAVLYGPRDVRFEKRDEPKIIKPTDAVIRISSACVCGSDLWPYRGIQPIAQPTPMGHEYCGIVEEVGREVRKIKAGQFVVGSFATSDNTCVICQHGYQSSFKSGSTVAVVGDGAVGLLGVLSAKQMGAVRIIAMSRHASRQKLAREFGATDIVTERGDEGVARIKELTNGVGADSVLECVGTQESMAQAIHSTRPGGYMGYVGVPHGVSLDGEQLFFSHVHLHGGPAPVRRYLPELINLVLDGKISPGKVFDLTLPLDQVAQGYRAMDERRAIKTLRRPNGTK